MKAATKIKFADMPRTYAELVAMYPPRPLHDDTDEANVEEIVLEMAGHKLNKDQDDYLDLMSDLLLKYEEEHYPLEPDTRTPLQRLKYILDENELSPRDLMKILGCSRPLVSLILSGKRELSKANIVALAKRFKVDAGYFL